MSIIRFKDLENIRENHKNEKVVFCSGCFDLTHAGHALFFDDCKKQGDVLVVMVGRDSNVRKHKGSERPILNQHLRLAMIDSLKPVDFCFLDLPCEKSDILEKNLTAVFQALRPDVYVVNDDAFDLPQRKEMVRARNITMKVLRRSAPKKFGGVSTTKIIEKVKKIKK